MIKIEAYGASDDLVEVEGCSGGDEFTHYNAGIWRGDLVAPDGGSLRLHIFYDGCWHVAVGQVDEEFNFPNWPISFRQEAAGYSTVLTVEAPDGTRLTNVGKADLS